MTSIQELMRQREELENKIQSLKNTEKQVAINEIRRLVQLHSLTPYDVFEEVSIKVEPLFMNPETGEKWSGRGKTPKWLEGKDRNLYLIRKD